MSEVIYDKKELKEAIDSVNMAQYSDVFERHVWARYAKVLARECISLRERVAELEEACQVAEQSLRNFANGDLRGDSQVIAHNAADRLMKVRNNA